MMTDPIADMLTRIRNAAQAQHEHTVLSSRKASSTTTAWKTGFRIASRSFSSTAGIVRARSWACAERAVQGAASTSATTTFHVFTTAWALRFFRRPPEL